MSDRLCSLAEAEIETLEAEGIKLTASDIIHINALAGRVENPQTRIALSRGKPVAVGGVCLWPQTLAGSDWFRRVGGNLPGRRLQTLALAYAMANGRATMPEDESGAQEAVSAWGRRLKCRMVELEEAIRAVIEQDETPIDTGETGNRVGAGELSLMLSAMTGVKPEVWEYQCSMTYVLDMLERMVAQNNADGKSTKHDPRIKAERALGLLIDRIRKRKATK